MIQIITHITYSTYTLYIHPAYKYMGCAKSGPLVITRDIEAESACRWYDDVKFVVGE